VSDSPPERRNKTPAGEVGKVFLFDPLSHESPVDFPGGSAPAEDKGCVIPGKEILVGKRVMAAPSGGIKFFRGVDDPGTERIEMDTANQLHEVGILLPDNGGVAVLEEMTSPAMPSVVARGIAGQEAAHEWG
jgi:hypothetical protein